jgi:hypothetical protein
VPKRRPYAAPNLDGLQVMLGEGRFFGLVPVGDGGAYGFAGLVSDRMQVPTESLLDRFASTSPTSVDLSRRTWTA